MHHVCLGPVRPDALRRSRRSRPAERSHARGASEFALAINLRVAQTRALALPAGALIRVSEMVE
jgi:hypothetical protein